MDVDLSSLQQYLDGKVKLYNNADFIARDPISIPHQFSVRQDIEIAGLMAATLSWGNRTTIINNCKKLMALMDNSPYDFIVHHQDTDLKRMLGFAHRTFNTTDLLYFISFLQGHYHAHTSLETAFVPDGPLTGTDTGSCLLYFHNYFFRTEHPSRTRKHVATPARNSACKRLNIYLRVIKVAINIVL